MLAQFPKEQETKREALLARVESIAPTLQASGGKSEELATLAPEAVTALRDAGLFQLKLPAVLGGAEADPVTEMLVLEEIATTTSPVAGAPWLAPPRSDHWARSCLKLDSSASSPADNIPTAAISFFPAGRAVR